MHSTTIGPTTLVLVQGDITREPTDAIANAANGGLVGGGGVDGAIHRAAGPELLAACRDVRHTLPGQTLETGGCVATPGFRLGARYVLHCVGPIYRKSDPEAPVLLARCYVGALRICRELGLRSVAFPAISTGVYGYPIEEAAEVTLSAIREQLALHGAPELVKIVLFDRKTLDVFVRAAERMA